MPQSLSQILVHAVFSTKDRRSFLGDANLRTELHAYLGGILVQLDCQPFAVGGVDDHVHLLFNLARIRDLASVVKETKRGSSRWMKTQGPALAEFAWQRGYGAFSIDASQLARVRRYIAGQVEHHRRLTFQDEFRTLLKRYDVPYDERYVWD
jgi:putative transposase